MKGGILGVAAVALSTAAGAAGAQTEADYTVVPVAERLTFGGVFADASLEVQIAMALMIAGAIASLVIWAMNLSKVGRADTRALAGGLGWLKIIRSAGVLLGVLTASFILLAGFIGVANVRPTPSLTVLAPGFAEASLAVMLGLLASTVAVICERHLEARIRRAAA
ncbi:hypothetical protein ACO2Q0_03130 [Phenylobacterium sp. VNQ135]|uniref:hypothetical protein n=1 Tax=Phenylobacterium sp. VNQ135 TaxID=3400922 RepID=UPI003BFDAB3D